MPRKNIRPFGGVEGGLIEIKLQQLAKLRQVDEIVLSTNDDEILELAQAMRIPKLRLHKRAEHLSSSQTSTDELISHAADLIKEGHILWTHVTSPFLTTEIYENIINRYVDAQKQGHDSLMTTTLIRSFLWNEKGPINYDRAVEKWPRTQTLEPLHEINSGVFLTSAEVYQTRQDRIGASPILYPLDKLAGFDIDWQEDFDFGELLLKSGLAKT